MGTIRVSRLNEIVYVMYSHERKRYRKSTGVKVEDQYWNKKSSSVRQNHPHHDTYNVIISTSLSKLIGQLSALRAQGKAPTVDNLKAHLVSIEKRKHYDFFRDYTQYLINKGIQLTDSSNKCHRQSFNLCKEFQLKKRKKWDIETLDKGFFDAFINFMLLDKNLVETTIQGHVKRFKGFIKHTYPDFDLRFIVFKRSKPANETIIYLHESEIRLLIDAQLERSTLQKVKDLFVFCCLTGMRYGDTQRYNPAWEDDGLLEFRMEKTGGKAYPPLYGIAREVLDRWGGKPPKISGQKYNQYLKELFQHLELNRMIPVIEKQLNESGKGYTLAENYVKLCDIISSHVARKTFITTTLIKGMPIQDVMRMSGHSDYRAMKPYIATSKKHLRGVSKLWEI